MESASDPDIELTGGYMEGERGRERSSRDWGHV
jgi:hypothetical protein